MATIRNGRLVGEIPDSGIYGEELIKGLKPRGKRRAVLLKGANNVETIEKDKRYTKRDLISQKTGRSVQMKTMPDRTKGQGLTYDKRRRRRSKQIILEQIVSVSENYYKGPMDFDEDDCNWVVFPKYILPERWRGIARISPLLISFPMEYPELPPVGFYLKASLLLQTPPNERHIYNNAYHNANKAPLEENWVWYCAYIESGGWSPASYRRPGDWNRGDSLWDYLTLIGEVLSSNK